jgi:5-methyltetrahydropteroyltriglutamate--homocysteine methyltransferase
MTAMPPFRADMVGSLLRAQPLKEARARRQAGEISAEALREVEDREIRKIIARQEQVGLEAATDGEFRRAWWHFDFLEGLKGVEVYDAEQGIQFHGTQTKPRAVRVTGKLGFAGHPMLEHFRFLAASTRLAAKMTIPSTSVLHFRGGEQAINKAVYPEMEGFFADRRRPIGRSCAPSPRRVAAISSSTTRSGPISARRSSARRCAPAARIPQHSRRSMPA